MEFLIPALGQHFTFGLQLVRALDLHAQSAAILAAPLRALIGRTARHFRLGLDGRQSTEPPDDLFKNCTISEVGAVRGDDA